MSKINPAMVRTQLGRNLTYRMLDSLGRSIVIGHYDKQAFPTEAELAKQHGVSRSVTQEAVKMLTVSAKLSATAWLEWRRPRMDWTTRSTLRSSIQFTNRIKGRSANVPDHAAVRDAIIKRRADSARNAMRTTISDVLDLIDRQATRRHPGQQKRK